MPRARTDASKRQSNQVMRLRLVDGSTQPHERFMSAIEPPSRRAESRGRLYILISAPGSQTAPRTLSEEVLETVGSVYYETGGSITRGLRDAILAANEHLFAYNVRVADDQRLALGLCCAVVRETDLYIGQMGPAIAVVSRDGALRRYPAHSAWVASDEPMGLQLNREPPLGLRHDAEPSLYHTEYRPTDGLLLASAHLLRKASDAQVAAALAQGSQARFAASLTELAGGQSVVALALPSPVAPSLAPAPAPKPDAEPVRSPEREDTSIDALPDRAHTRDLSLSPVEMTSAPEAPEPEPEPDYVADESLYAETADAEAVDAEAADAETADAEAAAADVPVAEAADTERLHLPPKAPMDQAAEPDYAQADRTGNDSEIERPATQERRAPREPRVKLGDVAETVGKSARRFRRGTEDALLHVLPTDVPERPSLPETPEPIAMGAKALVLVAMIIPLIVLFSVVMTRIQYDRAREYQYVNAILQAQYLYDQAARQPETQIERQELYRALDAIEQGLSIAPEDQDLRDLRRRALHRIDQLEGVIPIYSFARLFFFEDDAVSRTDSSRIVINGKDVMVLNRGSNLLYRFYLNDPGDALQPVEANPVIVRAGDTFDGVTVSDLIDVTWMASEGSQTLARFMVLDRSGTVLSYDPRRGMRAQPVGNSDMWLNPQAIASYYGNLYVLDPLLGRLLKYLPSNNEYVRPPLDYLDAALGVDLTGAVDVAIDGSVYVLYADGTISKFHNGVPVDFPMRGFYGTMRSPVAIHVSGVQNPDAEGYVYVADTGNKRVLQFTKDGIFLRQFRAVDAEPYMERLRGIYVDEAERRMYLISGQHFVLCTLPPLER
jgi:hypothetical protein